MAFPIQQYPPTQYHFLGSNDHQAVRRQQLEFVKRLKLESQISLGHHLSRIDREDYGDDILNCMFENEDNTLPDVASIDIQTEVEWFMRPFLLDFLVEAHAAFGLNAETFFLTVNILDRYCSKRVVYRKHYQLVGCTALLIAAKYDETSKQVPHIKELTDMCCNLYDEEMFIQMERHVLMTLDWHMGAPTAAGFVRAALNDGPVDDELVSLSLYLCEVAIYHREFVSERPSDIAKASIVLSRYILGRQNALSADHWSSMVDQTLPVALSTHLAKITNVLVQKYRHPQYNSVAIIVENYVDRQRKVAQASLMAEQTPPVTPLATPQHSSVSKSISPLKRRYPYDIELPPTPPETPEIVEGHNKKLCMFVDADSSHTSYLPQQIPYTQSFTMMDAV